MATSSFAASPALAVGQPSSAKKPSYTRTAKLAKLAAETLERANAFISTATDRMFPQTMEDYHVTRSFLCDKLNKTLCNLLHSADETYVVFEDERSEHWPVKFLFKKKTWSGGFRLFAQTKRLGEGDTLVYEKLDDIACMGAQLARLKVHLFRKASDQGKDAADPVDTLPHADESSSSSDSDDESDGPTTTSSGQPCTTVKWARVAAKSSTINALREHMAALARAQQRKTPAGGAAAAAAAAAGEGSRGAGGRSSEQPDKKRQRGAAAAAEDDDGNDAFEEVPMEEDNEGGAQPAGGPSSSTTPAAGRSAQRPARAAKQQANAQIHASFEKPQPSAAKKPRAPASSDDDDSDDDSQDAGAAAAAGDDDVAFEAMDVDGSGGDGEEAAAAAAQQAPNPTTAAAAAAGPSSSKKKAVAKEAASSKKKSVIQQQKQKKEVVVKKAAGGAKNTTAAAAGAGAAGTAPAARGNAAGRQQGAAAAAANSAQNRKRGGPASHAAMIAMLEALQCNPAVVEEEEDGAAADGEGGNAEPKFCLSMAEKLAQQQQPVLQLHSIAKLTPAEMRAELAAARHQPELRVTRLAPGVQTNLPGGGGRFNSSGTNMCAWQDTPGYGRRVVCAYDSAGRRTKMEEEYKWQPPSDYEFAYMKAKAEHE